MSFSDDEKRSFSDNDLARLKAQIPNARYGFDSLDYFTWADFIALIARLDAAEIFVNVYSKKTNLDSDYIAAKYYEAWLKSKGSSPKEGRDVQPLD